jgi:hypothetical protein
MEYEINFNINDVEFHELEQECINDNNVAFYLDLVFKMQYYSPSSHIKTEWDLWTEAIINQDINALRLLIRGSKTMPTTQFSINQHLILLALSVFGKEYNKIRTELLTNYISNEEINIYMLSELVRESIFDKKHLT